MWASEQERVKKWVSNREKEQANERTNEWKKEKWKKE